MKLQQLFEQEKFVIYNTKTKQLHSPKKWSTHKGAKSALSRISDNSELTIASELFFIDNIRKEK